MEIVIDKEFESFIFPLTDDEFKGLEQSIIKQGKCYDSIKVWESNGKTILCDGHNRYKICRKHGIEDYRVTALKFKDRNDAKVWIIENQLHRRNLNDFQRTELALRLKPELAEKAKENKKGRKSVVPAELHLITREKVAEAANVSESTVHRVETIIDEAPKKVLKATRNGELSISAAYQKVRPNLQKDSTKKKTALRFGGAFQITIENINSPNQIRRGRGNVAFKQSD